MGNIATVEGTQNVAVLPAPVEKTEGVMEGGKKVIQEASSQTILFVLAMLGIGGFGMGAAGIVSYVGAMSTLAQVNALVLASLGIGISVTSFVFLALNGTGKKCQCSQPETKRSQFKGSENDVEIILENGGKRIETSVEEIYQIAEGENSFKDRDAVLKEVKDRLAIKDFQTNPVLYVAAWIEERSKNTPVQEEAMEFFCYLIREVEDPRFPWNEPVEDASSPPEEGAAATTTLPQEKKDGTATAPPQEVKPETTTEEGNASGSGTSENSPAEAPATQDGAAGAPDGVASNNGNTSTTEQPDGGNQ